MGDALIKQVSPKGNSGNTLVAVYWGAKNGATEAFPTAKVRYNYDSGYFSYADNVFTAAKRFNAVVHIIGRGSYNSSGNQSYSNYTLYKNGTSLTSGSLANGGSGQGNYASVSLAAGDTLFIKTASSISSTVVSIGFFVEAV